MTVADILQSVRLVKEAGTSSKVPLPINVIEQICEQALAWQRLPEALKEYAQEGAAK